MSATVQSTRTAIWSSAADMSCACAPQISPTTRARSFFGALPVRWWRWRRKAWTWGQVSSAMTSCFWTRATPSIFSGAALADLGGGRRAPVIAAVLGDPEVAEDVDRVAVGRTAETDGCESCVRWTNLGPRRAGVMGDGQGRLVGSDHGGVDCGRRDENQALQRVHARHGHCLPRLAGLVQVKQRDEIGLSIQPPDAELEDLI